MLENLNPKHGFEVWINQMLVEKIEAEFKQALKTEELSYYITSCNCGKRADGEEHKSEVKWVGKTTLIDFIKKIQKQNHHFCRIGVTNAKNKKELMYWFDVDFHSPNMDDVKVWDYPIGDVQEKDMICGDDLFIQLWERVRHQKTKNATTRKKDF